MQTIAQPVKMMKKSDTRTATFAKNMKKNAHEGIFHYFSFKFL